MHRDHQYRNMHRGGRPPFLAIFILALLGLGLLVMILWNAILPNVSGVTKLNYWQAVGLLLLSRILFGNLWPGKKSRDHHKKAHMWRKKWMNMSDEDRARFKSEWKHRCKPEGTADKDIEIK